VRVVILREGKSLIMITASLEKIRDLSLPLKMTNPGTV
jgi:hypothetical protein